MKDHILLVKSQKYELNKKGMLRISAATYSDSGVYSCIGKRLNHWEIRRSIIIIIFLIDSRKKRCQYFGDCQTHPCQ